jgi:hypothetical protein
MYKLYVLNHRAIYHLPGIMINPVYWKLLLCHLEEYIKCVFVYVKPNSADKDEVIHIVS